MAMPGRYSRRVALFGYPRINACLRLPGAFRRLPAPSSASGTKASTVRLRPLDHACTSTQVQCTRYVCITLASLRRRRRRLFLSYAVVKGQTIERKTTLSEEGWSLKTKQRGRTRRDV